VTHYFDVFNGDADGICALHQLRLAQPQAATLITGVKRDISLLQQVSAEAGDQVTVLDIAMSKNQAALLDLLERDVHVRYFDHHIPGEIPQHPKLDAHIDTDANVCTSLLVNRYLNGAHLIWAVVAAFGDNMAQAARQAAVPLGLLDSQLDALRTLGECINYNGYGDTLADLYYPPAELYAIVHAYTDPFALMREEPAYRVLSHPCRKLYAVQCICYLTQPGVVACPVCLATGWRPPTRHAPMPCSATSQVVVMWSACVRRTRPNPVQMYCAARLPPAVGGAVRRASII
jgi:hypothetical protein